MVHRLRNRNHVSVKDLRQTGIQKGKEKRKAEESRMKEPEAKHISLTGHHSLFARALSIAALCCVLFFALLCRGRVS